MPNVIVEMRGRVGLLTLNRPEALNALNDALMRELGDALEAFGRNDAVGAVVITGSERAFAAGADIKEMQARTFPATYTGGFLEHWDRVALCRKPVIAAVAGFALGGGCELAMTCDIIIAADTAKFGQPEINLGIIPGAGGTQRLTRAIGKAKAMDLVLTGRMIDAAEADRIGLVSRLVPADRLLDEALGVAEKIAGLSRQAVLMAKEAVDASAQMPLSEGLRLERRLFQALFAGEDQKEGMQAFIEKRKPVFRHR